jgi:hypothetical protein
VPLSLVAVDCFELDFHAEGRRQDGGLHAVVGNKFGADRVSPCTHTVKVVPRAEAHNDAQFAGVQSQSPPQGFYSARLLEKMATSPLCFGLPSFSPLATITMNNIVVR